MLHMSLCVQKKSVAYEPLSTTRPPSHKRPLYNYHGRSIKNTSALLLLLSFSDFKLAKLGIPFYLRRIQQVYKLSFSSFSNPQATRLNSKITIVTLFKLVKT